MKNTIMHHINTENMLTITYELIRSTEINLVSASDTILITYWKIPLIVAAYAIAKPAKAGATCPCNVIAKNAVMPVITTVNIHILDIYWILLMV